MFAEAGLVDPVELAPAGEDLLDSPAPPRRMSPALASSPEMKTVKPMNTGTPHRNEAPKGDCARWKNLLGFIREKGNRKIDSRSLCWSTDPVIEDLILVALDLVFYLHPCGADEGLAGRQRLTE